MHDRHSTTFQPTYDPTSLLTYLAPAYDYRNLLTPPLATPYLTIFTYFPTYISIHSNLHISVLKYGLNSFVWMGRRESGSFRTGSFRTISWNGSIRHEGVGRFGPDSLRPNIICCYTFLFFINIIFITYYSA